MHKSKRRQISHYHWDTGGVPGGKGGGDGVGGRGEKCGAGGK